MSRETAHRLLRILFWIVVVSVYILAMLPGDPHLIDYGRGREVLVPADKTDHLVSFTVMTVLARLGWSRARSWLIAGGLAAFGALIELTQLVPALHREASWRDWQTDLVATAFGLLAGTALLMWLRSRPQSSSRT